MIQLNNLLVGPVARLPWRVQTKLLGAFLAIVALLIALGAIGLYELSAVNQRTEELIKSERKIAAYRQVQHDTTSQLYSISSALLVSDERTLDSALRQLNQFGYDLERLQFVAKAAEGAIDHTLLTSIIDPRGVLRVQYLGMRFDPAEFRRDLLSLVAK